MSKYKITIGDRVFDAERRNDGFYQLKCDKGDFKMNPDLIDALGAKIEEIKEPLRFEANVVWKACGGFAYPEGNANWHQLVGKKGKLTFVESIPDQSEFFKIKCDDPNCYACNNFTAKDK